MFWNRDFKLEGFLDHCSKDVLVGIEPSVETLRDKSAWVITLSGCNPDGMKLTYEIGECFTNPELDETEMAAIEEELSQIAVMQAFDLVLHISRLGFKVRPKGH